MTNLRLDLVIRTSKRKKEARSPEQQRKMAEAIAAANGYVIVAEHDSMADESGKTMDRASLHEVMRRVRSGETDGIILGLLDRLGRAPIEEAMTWVRELDAIGGKLVPADAGGQAVNLADPQAETNLVLQLQIARQYWRQTQKRTRESREEAVKAGRYVGSAVAGFDKVESGDDKGKLVHNDDAPFMREVFLAIGAQRSLRPAQTLLRERWPHGRWDTDTVRKLLASPAYKGWSVSGDLVNRHAHDPIVTEAQWEAAQQAPRERRANGDYPLSAIVTCADCGVGMTGGVQTVPGRSPSRRYRCTNKACPGEVSIVADALERHVREWLRPLVVGGYFDVQFGDGELTEARATLDRARAEREEFAGDLALQRDLGPEGRRAQARALREAVEHAEAHHREVSGRAARVNHVVLTEAKLDTFEGLAAAARLAAGIIPIAVTRGRASIGRRVPLPMLDDGPGVLAA